MGSVLKYAAVNTKVKALEGYMLKKDEYIMLMECKNYHEAISFLKDKTSYRKELQTLVMEELHRGQLELILKKQYINNFCKLSHYFVGEYKKLFEVLFMRFEIEDLKVIIRGKFIGRTKEDIMPYLTYESPLSNIDYYELASAKNLEGVVEILKDTPYYKYVNPLLPSIKDEGLFRMEMTLDLTYFSFLRKSLKKISKEDKEILKKLNGIYADLLNIQWVYRGFKYYNLKPEELFNYTLYDGYKLKDKDIRKLCYIKSLDEFYETIEKLPYREVFINCKERDYLVEKEILSYLKKMYEKAEKTNQLNISVVISYLELLLLEIRDITSIVENKRYNLQKTEGIRYITATTT